MSLSSSISVIVPTRNSAVSLRRCLAAIQSSTSKPDRCVVVDDFSDEPVQHIVEEFGFTYLRTPVHMGPAAARNLGAKSVDTDILFFTDDDVEIQAGTLARVQATFDADPELTALIGSYDDEPGRPDFLSQYRNLQHHFVHQSSRNEASTFWSGCGAIRRDEFVNMGGFSESFRRPSVEDIELGYRLYGRGLRMKLDKDLQVKHLKRWTFGKLLLTDIRDRGFPWARILLDRRSMPADLNLTVLNRFFVLLAVLVAVGAAWSAAAGATMTLVLPLWLIESSLLGSMLWNSLPLVRSASARQGLDWGLGSLLIIATSLILFRVSSDPIALVAVASYALLIALNAPFHLFLVRKRGLLFSCAAAPLQLLFHLGNAFSFSAAVASRLFTRDRTSAADARAAAAPTE